MSTSQEFQTRRQDDDPKLAGHSGAGEMGTLDVAIFRGLLNRRQSAGRRWRTFFFAATTIGIVALVILFITVIDEAFGMIAIQEAIPPGELSDRPLEELSPGELGVILGENIRKLRLRSVVRSDLLKLEEASDNSIPVSELLAGHAYPEPLADKPFGDLDELELGALLAANFDQERMHTLVIEEVVKREVVGSWPVHTVLLERERIDQELAASEFAGAELKWHSWLTLEFLLRPMSSTPALAGIRIALFGSLWIILITMIAAVPLGVGAAIYLEEYATDTWYNRLFETNIRNLAGVPSIIYGMLGLAIFVRVMGEFTSGAMFGVTESNGRTIISASFTLALLILPIIIINAQEAIRAVPWSIREASYGLGATQWQTIWRQVLPAALPGILTGTIISLSRAIGETAPLIVVGASAVIFVDPEGPFSKFTALPIQIWQWTARPQDQFRDIAAAAIVVLLVLLLLLNTTAIVLRQRFSRRF